MRTHHAGHRAFVGEGEGGVAERRRAFDQFLRVRGAAQEREVRQAVQLGIGRQAVVAAFTGPDKPAVAVGYQPVAALDVDGAIQRELDADYVRTEVSGQPIWRRG